MIVASFHTTDLCSVYGTACVSDFKFWCEMSCNCWEECRVSAVFLFVFMFCIYVHCIFSVDFFLVNIELNCCLHCFDAVGWAKYLCESCCLKHNNSHNSVPDSAWWQRAVPNEGHCYPSVLWCWWLGYWESIWPAEKYCQNNSHKFISGDWPNLE